MGQVYFLLSRTFQVQVQFILFRWKYSYTREYKSFLYIITRHIKQNQSIIHGIKRMMRREKRKGRGRGRRGREEGEKEEERMKGEHN